MVRVRKTAVSTVIPVSTPSRVAKAAARKAFLARTDGRVLDETTGLWVVADNYSDDIEATSDDD